MSRQGWQETLIVAAGDGSPVTNTTALSLLPAQAKYTLPAGFFSEAGKMIRIRASGRASNIVTTPGTLTLDVRFGTVATPIIVFNGGAMALNTTATTNMTWSYEAILTCRSVGASTSATMLGTAKFASRIMVGSAAVAAGSPGEAQLPDTAPAAGTGFDSTITNVVDFFATWSINNAGNTLTLHQYMLESLN